MHRASTCPTCRAQSTSCSDAHSTASLVDLYLGLPGNEQVGRSSEDKTKMDELYKPGQLLVKGPPRQQNDCNDDGFYDVSATASRTLSLLTLQYVPE